MPYSPRARRVILDGTRVHVGHSVADLINVSLTGALVKAPREFAPQGDCIIVLKIKAVILRMTARVVRSTPADVPSAFFTALAFVKLSPSTRTVLRGLCGPHVDSGTEARQAHSWKQNPIVPRVPRRVGLYRLSISWIRCCPRCRGRGILKDKAYHYVCMDCRRAFIGFRLGRFRVAI